MQQVNQNMQGAEVFTPAPVTTENQAAIQGSTVNVELDLDDSDIETKDASVEEQGVFADNVEDKLRRTYATYGIKVVDPMIDTTATRNILRSEVFMSEDYKLVVYDESTVLTLNASVSRKLFAQALVYDVREVALNRLSPNLFDFINQDLNTTSQKNFTDVEDHPALVDLQSVTYKTKSGKEINVLKRTQRLLGEIRELIAMLSSLDVRLRALEATTATPHVISGEFTAGSTAEQSAVKDQITTRRASLDSLVNDVQKMIGKLNNALSVTDSGWLVELPEQLAEISALNPPYPKDSFDPDLKY